MISWNKTLIGGLLGGGISLGAVSASAQNVVRVSPGAEPPRVVTQPASSTDETSPSEAPAGEAAPEPGAAATPGASTAEPAVDPPVEGDEPSPTTTAPSGEAKAEPQNPVTQAQGGGIRLVGSGDDTPPAEEERDPNTQPFTHHQRHVSAQLGLRVNWVPSSTFDAFSGRDVLVSPVLRVGLAPWASGPFSLAFTPEWSFASVRALARGAATGLSVQRLSVGLEGRLHLHHRYYAYARVSPGAAFLRTTLGEPNGTELADENWSFRVDGTVGAAARLAGDSDGSKPGPRFLAYVEGGFDWTAAAELRLEAAGQTPPRVAPLALGSLDLSGPHVGGGLMLTY